METQMYLLLDFFKALANESRLKLLARLASRECSVEELAAWLELKEPTVSHHLAKLKAIDLVKMRAEGNTHLYSLAPEGLQRMNRQVLTPESIAALAEGEPEGPWEAKVLQTFLVDGKLIKIPASRKKRLVILQWLAGQFEPGQRYPEKAINALIKHYHEDCATLRRELVGNGLMAREQGIYWRV